MPSGATSQILPDGPCARCPPAISGFCTLRNRSVRSTNPYAASAARTGHIVGFDGVGHSNWTCATMDPEETGAHSQVDVLQAILDHHRTRPTGGGRKSALPERSEAGQRKLLKTCLAADPEVSFPVEHRGGRHELSRALLQETVR